MDQLRTFKYTVLLLISIAVCWVLHVTYQIGISEAWQDHSSPQGCSTDYTFETTVTKAEMCNEYTQSSNLIQPITVTSLSDWSFNTTVKCPPFEINSNLTSRLKVVLECDGDVGRLVHSLANSSQDISVVEFGNKCLEYVIKKCCSGNKLVPNVMHYVWFYSTDMDFFHFISFMSTIRFIKPCLILIHGPSVPTGKYWDYVVSISPNIILVKRERPTTIFGKEVAYIHHSSDIMRIEALINYGGIFMDFDQVALRPLEPLRQYEHTQAVEEPGAMGNQLIMARRNSTFLQHWYNSYKTDYRDNWVWNAQQYPYQLSNRYPNLIHVEGNNFAKPNWQNRSQIHNASYDWSTNYGMHIVSRAAIENTIDLNTIRDLNTTVGSVSRHILFGNKEICEK